MRLTRNHIRRIVNESVRRILMESNEDRMRIAKEFDKLSRNGRMSAFDIEDYSDEPGGEPYGVLWIGYNPKTNLMYAGDGYNAGVARRFELEYDDTFSIDENLQALYEEIIEKSYYVGERD